MTRFSSSCTWTIILPSLSSNTRLQALRDDSNHLLLPVHPLSFCPEIRNHPGRPNLVHNLSLYTISPHSTAVIQVRLCAYSLRFSHQLLTVCQLQLLANVCRILDVVIYFKSAYSIFLRSLFKCKSHLRLPARGALKLPAGTLPAAFTSVRVRQFICLCS